MPWNMTAGRSSMLSIDVKRNGGPVEIVIADTGSGIGPENLDQIFEPLFTDKPQGTGPGLSIDKRSSASTTAQSLSKVKLEPAHRSRSSFRSRLENFSSRVFRIVNARPLPTPAKTSIRPSRQRLGLFFTILLPIRHPSSPAVTDD